MAKYAAVDSHMKNGCSVTHKVHLMWVHVGKQMRLPQELTDKYLKVDFDMTVVAIDPVTDE